jgi:Domain of unknown function (DUF4351)
MTRIKHDQFAKQLLSGLLEAVGDADTEVNVTSEIRKIDLLFVPFPDKAADREKLGLLGRIATTSCLIEPYRNAPALLEIRASLLRLFIQHGEHNRKAKREDQDFREDDHEMLWIVGPTISKAVLAAFGAQPSQEWGRGIYFAVSGLRTALVAVHQLVAERDTLWLRILGRGKVQKQAIAEVLAIPNDDSLRNLALKLINAWKIRTEQLQDISQDEQELLMNLSPAYLAWEEQTLQKGQQEAQCRMLLRLLTHKFGSLNPQVVEQIQSITDTEKLEQLGEMLMDVPDLLSFLQNL